MDNAQTTVGVEGNDNVPSQSQFVSQVTSTLEPSIGKPITTQTIDDVVKMMESSINPEQTQTITDVVERLESSISPEQTQTVDEVTQLLESSIGEPIAPDVVDSVIDILEQSVNPLPG